MIFTKEDKEFYLEQRIKQNEAYNKAHIKSLEQQELEFQQVRTNMILEKNKKFTPSDIIRSNIDNIPSEEDVLDNIKPKRQYTKRNDYPSHWNKKMKSKFISYYNRCNDAKREFGLTYNQFENQFTKSCVYCGSSDNITIDRIDSSIGYIIDNCQPCCNDCNKMKLNMTHDQFLTKIRTICTYCPEK